MQGFASTWYSRLLAEGSNNVSVWRYWAAYRSSVVAQVRICRDSRLETDGDTLSKGKCDVEALLPHIQHCSQSLAGATLKAPSVESPPRCRYSSHHALFISHMARKPLHRKAIIAEHRVSGTLLGPRASALLLEPRRCTHRQPAEPRAFSATTSSVLSACRRLLARFQVCLAIMSLLAPARQA